MKYNDILNDLKRKGCKQILVTGPHRGGTTFSAYALASDLKLGYYKEENIHGGGINRLSLFKAQHSEFVLQLPGFSHQCHNIEFDAVIFINRNTEDVLKSMSRLTNKLIENQTTLTLNLLKIDNSELTLPELKLKAFVDIQTKLIKNPYILDYESLSDHEKFIPREDRDGFNIRQVVKKTTKKTTII